MEDTIGLFFGSFNPIHIGHMAIANYVLEYGNLKEIWFVVSPHNPVKNKSTLLTDYHRLSLVNCAIGDNYARYKASNIEFNLPKPSYTVDTLTYLKEKYPDKKFTLIMGEDNLEGFQKWKNYEIILNQFRLIVYPRPGYDGGALKHHPSVSLVNAPLMEISSSFIRNAIKEGKNIEYFLPNQVWQEVCAMHFYKK